MRYRLFFAAEPPIAKPFWAASHSSEQFADLREKYKPEWAASQSLVALTQLRLDRSSFAAATAAAVSVPKVRFPFSAHFTMRLAMCRRVLYFSLPVATSSQALSRATSMFANVLRSKLSEIITTPSKCRSGFDPGRAGSPCLSARKQKAVDLSHLLQHGLRPPTLSETAFDGENDEDFLRTGSRLVIVAPQPLAIGVAADVFVADYKVGESVTVAVSAGVPALLVLLSFVYGYPLWRSRTAGPARRAAPG